MGVIRIANSSVSVVVSGYGVAEIRGEPVVVYLDIAPQHPKAMGAIWANLVSGTKEKLVISDDQVGESFFVRGLARRYHRLAMDAPRIAGRARPKHIRLVAPMACQIDSLTKPFVALAWQWRDHAGVEHSLTPATSLAAMLERSSPLPVLISWGEYLLAEAQERGFATPLIRGGEAPEGVVIDGAPWEAILADGITSGRIQLM